MGLLTFSLHLTLDGCIDTDRLPVDPEPSHQRLLRGRVQALKDATSNGVLLGSGKLATELDRLDLIEEYRLRIHPRITGHGPTLYENGLTGTRPPDLASTTPLRSGMVALHYRCTR